MRKGWMKAKSSLHLILARLNQEFSTFKHFVGCRFLAVKRVRQALLWGVSWPSHPTLMAFNQQNGLNFLKAIEEMQRTLAKLWAVDFRR